MQSSFKEYMRSKIVLFDGATGTTLQAMGLPIGTAPEEWIFENPDAVYQNHLGYIEAGADVVLTNTLGANSIRLKDTDLADKAYELNKKAAELARKAAGETTFVAGSVGPTGVILMMGEISEEQVQEAYRQQIQGLIDGGIDVIAVETMTDIEEACLAVGAAKDISTLPVIATMTYEAGKQGFRTVMGNDIKTVVERLNDAGADATGSNCGTGIDTMIEIIKEMKQYTHLPLLAEPNAGLPEIVDGKIMYRESAEFMANKVKDLLQAGARLVGGCCGTTFEHIREFRKIIDTYGR